MRIVLTQAEGRLEKLEGLLRSAGHEVLSSPLIRTERLETPEVRARAKSLLECPWLLFTSRSAVQAWVALGLPLEARLGAVGKATGAALRAAGGYVSLVGSPETAAGLAAVFARHSDAAEPVGLPQGDRTLGTLQDKLEQHGFETRPLVLYRTLTCEWRNEEADAVVLASPSAAAALPEKVGARARLVVLGPSTAAAVKKRGWPCWEAETPDAEAVLQVLTRWT